jgi:hypothetical protein
MRNGEDPMPQYIYITLDVLTLSSGDRVREGCVLFEAPGK